MNARLAVCVKLAACLAVMVIDISSGLAQDSPQQQHMRACNQQAGDLTGDERKTFMMDCLRKSAQASPKPSSPVKDATLFGVTIGRQLDSYPSCDSEEGREKICVYPPIAGLPNHRRIELRPGRPEYLTSNFMIGTRPDGTINFVSADTGGLKYQDEIYEFLTRRYGKPPSVKRSIVQNAFGAKFEKIEASWSLQGGALIFHGVEDRIDQGSIGLVADRP